MKAERTKNSNIVILFFFMMVKKTTAPIQQVETAQPDCRQDGEGGAMQRVRQGAFVYACVH